MLMACLLTAGLAACPAINTGENSIRIFALVTDFRPEYNDDFGAAKLSSAGADKNIVQTMLGGDRTPVYAGSTPTTSGAASSVQCL